MKTKELREFNTEDLVQKEKALKKEFFDLNYQRKMGMVEKPSRFRQLKRDIARIFTIIRERELNNERDSEEAK